MAGAKGLTRRDWLQRALAGASVAALGPGAWARVRTPTDPFALGVASGSPLQDSVVLWTRLLVPAGQPDLAVRWELAHDEGFTRIVQAGQTPAPAALGHAVHVEVQGLAPDRGYFYRFAAGDALSATGHTRTLPAAGAQVAGLRLAYASCQRWEHGHFSAWRHMLADQPDLVLFLGDYIYEYAGAPQPVRSVPGGWVLTLDDYRRRYAVYKSDPALQAMHAACPWLVTWDDHEVQNDYAGLKEGSSGVPVADFAARRAAAYQAFYEHMPLRASVLTRALAGLESGAEMRIYSRLQYGRLASLSLLDARQYKDPQACTRDGNRGAGTLDPASCAAWKDPVRSLLGNVQERWLDNGFSSAASREIRWNVLGQQTLFGRRNFRSGAGQVLWNDGWDGYSAARSRVIDGLQKHAVANPVLLGGDVHENWVGHVKADYDAPGSRNIGVEFCGTSISSRSAGNEKIPQVLAANPHFVFADSDKRGYGLVDFTPSRLDTTLRVVDDVSLPDSGVSTLARFSVQAGRAQIERS
ncbi:MAG: alkaline phosphatase D family protein [Polaromonas sp.]|nr:alkaline phosphatase D family protein [Polaromonas sp.]